MHHSTVCCGRAGVEITSKRQSRDYVMIGPGVRKYSDGHERRSGAALKQLKDKKLRTDPTCFACKAQFSDYREVHLAHIISKGSGGWRHDDSEANTVLLHAETNLDCGSRNLNDYLEGIRAAGKKFPCEVAC